jgi:hypothetical protein
MTLDLEIDEVGLTFDEVQGLRNLEDRALSLKGHCNGAVAVTQRLQKIAGAGLKHEWALEPYSDRLSDFGESLLALMARIKNTIDLVGQKTSSFHL